MEVPLWKIVEKDLVDEIIFRTMKPRNRIMLELMARGGMRVGEVLKIGPMDIQDRKLTLAGPKSGKESGVVFIPQKVADRLKEYVKEASSHLRYTDCLAKPHQGGKKKHHSDGGDGGKAGPHDVEPRAAVKNRLSEADEMGRW